MPASGLLEPEFLRKLERLSLVAKKVFTGQLKGERRSAKRGASVEFADYRSYVLGDDLRYVDWNTYARLERLFLKLFMEEEDLHVYLLIDGSQSMASGAKFDYARRVAAALGYVGLAGYDRVGAAVFGDSLRHYLPPLRGRAQVFRYFQFLEGAVPEGRTSLSAALKEVSLRCRRTGVAILVSDFFDPEWETGLKAFLARRFQTTVIQVLEPREVNPDYVGDLKLIDSETGEEREISISPALLRDYRRTLDEFCRRIEATCRRYGADYLRATTDVPFEGLVLKWLRATGLVK